jgi:hypothetical protein
LLFVDFGNIEAAAFFAFSFKTVTGIKFGKVIIWESGFRASNKSFSTTRYIYLLKRDVFGTAIPFLNFSFFFIILIALDGNISESFSLADFTRVAVMPALALSGLRYTLKLLSYFFSFESLGTCIPFIPIRIVRRLTPVSFPAWVASAAKTLFLIVFFSVRKVLTIIVLS